MFLMTAAPNPAIIADMPDVEEMITISEAAEMADGRYTRRRIAQVAKSGEIPGATRIGHIWVVPRAAFIQWLNEERRPGPKTEN